MIWILLCIPAGDVRLSIVRPTLICWVNYLLQGEKRVFGLPQRKFSLWFILLLQHISSLRSPTYSVIRRSPSKWGLIIVAMLKLGFWTEIGVSFVAQFWHNFCHSLVASVICQMFLFRVYKILSEIINIRCLCRSEGSLCFKWNVLAKNISKFAIFFGIWKINLNYSATLQKFFTMKLAQIHGSVYFYQHEMNNEKTTY